MNSDAFYARFSSDCIIGSANQELVRLDQPQTITGRCRYRLAHGGAQFSLLFSNIIDSTYADGSVSRAGDVGGTWTIHQMRIGLRDDDRAAEPAQWFPVTFDGAAEKTVTGAVTFATDPVALHARAGQTLCYELTFTGDCCPHHPEALLPVEVQTDDGFVPDKRIPLPLMIGCDRPVRRRIGFIGDSITQGIGTETGSYAHWAARIAARFPADCSAWDMGSGYARAADAAQDGAWLARAKTCDLVHVCFGVNDLYHDRRTADEVLADLQTIVRALKHARVREDQTTYCHAHLEYDDGIAECWEVEFAAGAVEYEYEIALDGTVQKSEQESHAAAAGVGDIGAAGAQSIAMKHAGVRAADAAEMETDRDTDDGRIVYEVEFRAGQLEYEYEIDGASGAVLKHKVKRDD